MLDTNNPLGAPGRIVDLLREGKLELTVDDRILAEYIDHFPAAARRSAEVVTPASFVGRLDGDLGTERGPPSRQERG